MIFLDNDLLKKFTDLGANIELRISDLGLVIGVRSVRFDVIFAVEKVVSLETLSLPFNTVKLKCEMHAMYYRLNLEIETYLKNEREKSLQFTKNNFN